MSMPCQCPAAGWCERHQMQKNQHLHHLCQTREDYRRTWDERTHHTQLESARQLRVVPCVHRGACLPPPPGAPAGGQSSPVYACARYKQCVADGPADGPIASCLHCPAYERGVTLAARHEHTPLRWMVGVTTTKRKESMLVDTLESLTATGWSAAHLFIDGDMPAPSGFTYTQRNPRIGGWPNWALGLGELVLREPEADAYLMVQDDVRFCANVRTYLESVEWPADTGVFSLYTASGREGPPGWRRLPSRMSGMGALAYAIPGSVARRLAFDPMILQHRTGEHGLKRIDTCVARWLLRHKLGEYAHTPSLCTHSARFSAMNNGPPTGKRNTRSFPGVTFDACSMLVAPPDSIDRALVIITGGLGNVIQQSPMVRAAQTLAKGVDVIIDSGPYEYLDVLRGLPGDIRFLPAYQTPPLPYKMAFCVSWRLRAYPWRDKAARTVYAGGYQPRTKLSEVEFFVNLTRRAGFKGATPDCVCYTDPWPEPLPNKLLIGFCSGSNSSPYWRIKRYSAEKFAEVCELLLRARPDIALVHAGSPDDPAVLHPAVIDCRRAGNVRQMAGLVSRCSLFFGNDSGLCHVAAALGVPSYPIFGPTCPWRNVSPKNMFPISRNLPCQPCQYSPHRMGYYPSTGLPCRRECLDELSPEMVAQALLEVLPPT